MQFSYCFKTDIGTTRENNQDSGCAEVIKTAAGRAFLGLVCDGMGGLAKGAFASRTVVETFRSWFGNDFPRLAESGITAQLVFHQWSELIRKVNEALIDMSENFGEQMGTTLSALLIVNGEFFVAQVGDSRVYLSSGGSIVRVTVDHSYVMEQVRKGLMTESEAQRSHKRNVLTRCIGVMKEVSGDFYNGSVGVNDSFLISSDGFHGGTDDSEILAVLAGLNVHRKREAERRIERYIEMRKRGGERDNITALAVIVG